MAPVMLTGLGAVEALRGRRVIITQEKNWVRPHEVLVALHGRSCTPRWLDDVDHGLRSSGYTAIGAYDDPEAIRFVERGGLAAAVLMGEGTALASFTLLRIIRSISTALPCWLITDDPTPHTLQTALALGVHSVMKHPVEASLLTVTVTRGLEFVGSAFPAGNPPAGQPAAPVDRAESQAAAERTSETSSNTGEA